MKRRWDNRKDETGVAEDFFHRELVQAVKRILRNDVLRDRWLAYVQQYSETDSDYKYNCKDPENTAKNFSTLLPNRE